MTRHPEHRPGRSALWNPPPHETRALDAEAARIAQRRRDEAALARGYDAGAHADWHAGFGYGSRHTTRPSLLARLWRRIRGRG